MAKKKKSTTASGNSKKNRSSTKQPPVSAATTNTTQQNKDRIRFAVIGGAALSFIVVIAIVFNFFNSSLTSFQQSTTTATTTSAQTKEGELFLTWLTDNGAFFHPIKKNPINNDTSVDTTDDDDGVQITIQKFDGMGWGLAAIVNNTSSNDVCESSTRPSSEEEEEEEESCSTQQAALLLIPHLTPLFTIPSNLIISISSILHTYSSSSSSSSSSSLYYLSNFYHVVNKVLLTSFPRGQGLAKMQHHNNNDNNNGVRMGLVEQDVVIAMMLMTEDCLHRHDHHHHHGDGGGGGGDSSNNSSSSFWGPYLDMLPSSPLPRLDTFENDAYAMLNDAKLEMAGRSSKQLLTTIFYGSTKGGDDDDDVQQQSSSMSIKAVVRDMINIRLSNNNNPSTATTMTSTTAHEVPPVCLQFDTFHKFIGIVSSRAMVLKGIKYLTPLAEMINYSPVSPSEQVVQRRRSSRSRGAEEEDFQATTTMREEDWMIHTPFDLYHTIGDDDSITVRSDRNVMLHHQHQHQSLSTHDDDTGDTITTTTTIQIFEDYGPVDSSLFLEMHAFVPSNNPNHCAIIHGIHFLRRQVAPGRSDPNSTLLLRALKALHLTNPQLTKFISLEDVCVRTDMSIVDDGTQIGRRPASDAIAITSLLLGDSTEMFTNNLELLKSKCITAIESNDVERIELQCARYPGSGRVVKHALVNAARRCVEKADVTMDTLSSWLEEAEEEEGEDGSEEKLVLALRFRIEERKILDSIANTTSLIDDTSMMKPTVSESPPGDDLDVKISSFNAFIDSLDLPVNKIRAQAVEGLRLGTVATEDLESEEAYISLPPNAVIDAVTALADAEISSPRLAALLKKFDSQQRSDGFDALLVYLLHERFVSKGQSKWWPYLDLLPTVEDVSSSHPLFFEEDEMNLYLGGSDVRKFILRSQRRAFERHAALASDVDVHDVLGSHIILDKILVYWATAILDSRSIWWGGKRHLCPLLDLVNADTVGRPHETAVEEPLAVTRTSRRCKRGEQVFENYQQPNYLLFAFHGFMLDNNPSDCALLGGLTMNQHDPGAKYASRLQSSPTFCISGSNIDSMEELAQFLQMKHGLSTNKSESEAWLNEDVVPYLTQVLEERIARLGDVAESGAEMEDQHVPQRRRFMSHVVRSDLAHFQGALELMKKRS